MKRFLSLIITLTLVFMMFALAAPKVAAEVPANDCTTDYTVVLHYHRWDDDYTDMDFWSWGTGSLGSGNPQIVGEDDFGAVAYMCIDDDGVTDDPDNNPDDADDSAGLIPRLNDWSYKDGIDTNGDGTDDKSIPLRDEDGELVGFDENGIKHVYVLQGSADVYVAETDMPFFQQEDMGTLVVIYYDPVESYDGWNMWNWGTGTNGVDENEDPIAATPNPNEFQWNLGIDQQDNPEKFKVAVFNIAADADDTIGFIVRTDAWDKQWGEDLFIDVADIKGSGTQFTFYIGGNNVFYDNFVDFEAVVNFFEITSAKALDPNSIEVVFNKDVVTKVDDVITFDPTSIVLTDKDDTEIDIESISFDSTAEANDTFTLILDDELVGANSPFTVTYTVGEDVYTKEFSVDVTPPVITIIGSQSVDLELGDLYSLPTYSASDMVGDESVAVYNVKVKADNGTVDTRYAGIYEVVIIAEDNFGNTAEKVITVTVKDPCDETAHLDANNFNAELIALLIGIPLAIGAMITLRRGY